MFEVFKQPYEAFFVTVDFEEELASGETLTSASTVVAYDSAGTALLAGVIVEAGSIVVSGSLLSARIIGGSEDLSPYKLAYRCVTNIGSKYEEDVKLKVKEL